MSDANLFTITFTFTAPLLCNPQVPRLLRHHKTYIQIYNQTRPRCFTLLYVRLSDTDSHFKSLQISTRGVSYSGNTVNAIKEKQSRNYHDDQVMTVVMTTQQ